MHTRSPMPSCADGVSGNHPGRGFQPLDVTVLTAPHVAQTEPLCGLGVAAPYHGHFDPELRSSELLSNAFYEGPLAAPSGRPSSGRGTAACSETIWAPSS